MITTSQIALIGGLILTALTILSNVAIAWISKRSELKKELHKTIIDCAYKEWEANTKLVYDIAEKNGKKATFYPFSYYLLFYNRFIKLMDKKSLSEAEVRDFFKNSADENFYMQKYQDEFKRKKSAP